MAEEHKIEVFEVVGSGLCVASDDGQKVHDDIAEALRRGLKVKLSFQNVQTLTSAFLNAAIGQLYGEFAEEQIKSSLTITALDRDDMALLRRVVETAKQYFKEADRVREARKAVLGEDNES